MRDARQSRKDFQQQGQSLTPSIFVLSSPFIFIFILRSLVFKPHNLSFFFFFFFCLAKIHRRLKKQCIPLNQKRNKRGVSDVSVEARNLYFCLPSGVRFFLGSLVILYKRLVKELQEQYHYTSYSRFRFLLSYLNRKRLVYELLNFKVQISPPLKNTVNYNKVQLIIIRNDIELKNNGVSRKT